TGWSHSTADSWIPRDHPATADASVGQDSCERRKGLLETWGRHGGEDDEGGPSFRLGAAAGARPGDGWLLPHRLAARQLPGALGDLLPAGDDARQDDLRLRPLHGGVLLGAVRDGAPGRGGAPGVESVPVRRPAVLLERDGHVLPG